MGAVKLKDLQWIFIIFPLLLVFLSFSNAQETVNKAEVSQLVADLNQEDSREIEEKLGQLIYKNYTDKVSSNDILHSIFLDSGGAAQNLTEVQSQKVQKIYLHQFLKIEKDPEADPASVVEYWTGLLKLNAPRNKLVIEEIVQIFAPYLAQKFQSLSALDSSTLTKTLRNSAGGDFTSRVYLALLGNESYKAESQMTAFNISVLNLVNANEALPELAQWADENPSIQNLKKTLGKKGKLNGPQAPRIHKGDPVSNY